MSLYLPKYNTIFLHIPKTAGTYVKKLFDALSIETVAVAHEHDTLATTKRYNPDIFSKDPLVVAFVRHPVSWYRSYWRYRMDCFLPDWIPFGQGHVTESIDYCGDSDLNVFVNKCIDYHPGFLTNLYKSYYLDSDTNEEIGFIGRYEYLTYDLIRLLVNRLDMSILLSSINELPYQNVSKGPHDVLSADIVGRIWLYEHEIIRRFWP